MTDNNVKISSEEDPPNARVLQSKKHIILITLFVLTIGYGVLNAFIYKMDGWLRITLFAWGLLAHALIALWCRYDRQAQIGETGGKTGFAFLIPAVGFVIHCIQTRGWAGIGTILCGMIYGAILAAAAGYTTFIVGLFFVVGH